jgi:hypothetical protein
MHRVVSSDVLPPANFKNNAMMNDKKPRMRMDKKTHAGVFQKEPLQAGAGKNPMLGW